MYLGRVAAELAQIDANHRRRHIEPRALTDVLDFTSNDYLAMSRHPQVLQAFRQAQRVGSGAARLLSGRHREHSLLEEELAEYLGRQRALLFSSGYLAALGAVTTLSRLGRAIVSDELNHASLIDGMSLTRLPTTIYPHRQLPSRQSRPPGSLIVSESLFSMDGDTVDVEAMVADLGDDDILLLDEAHAIGVLGPRGAGLAFAVNDPRVVIMGTLSKSFGGLGGFIAGPAPVIELCINTARSFIFDTALPPALALAARVALSLIIKADDRRATIAANAQRLRLGLASLGYPVDHRQTQIVPVLLGDEVRALDVAACLRASNIEATAIRPPTVAPGSSRLRLALRSDQASEHIDLLIEALARCNVTS